MFRAEEACRLLYVGDDGDVYQASGSGKTLKLTWGWSDVANPERLYYVWPAYSPDGSQVACFGVRSGSVPEASLFTVANDGIRMHELWRMTEAAAPVCESWSPDSRSIALLLQGENELQLEIAQVHRPGRTIPIDRGAPLFWSWSPRAGYLAVHTGGSATLYDDARLSIFHVDDECTRIVELAPGEFRTPTWSPDGSRLAYIDASDGTRELLAFYRMDDGTIDVVHQVHGQTVMLWSPDGRTLAVSQALGDSPHVYSGLTLVDVESGNVSVIDESELVSFYWSPCSRRIVTMSFESHAGMQWHVLDTDGAKRRLGSNFYPSRELVYFSWFFDQFAASHPLISPDGSRLVFAGHMNDRGGLPERGRRSSDRGPLPLRGESNVYVASLDDNGPVERLAAGHFACWDAQVRANAA